VLLCTEYIVLKVPLNPNRLTAIVNDG